MTLIEALDETSNTSEVEAAREAYDNLSEAQQQLVTNLNRLESFEGLLILNPTFNSGIDGWNDSEVVYIADGAAMELSSENGTLKAEVTAGANFFTPRFGQMNIPFENGKTYEVIFDAKSSVEKEITIQFGELLKSTPWYIDFLPEGQSYFLRTVTTDWKTFTIVFTMNQDNQNGGILIGLGTVNNNKVNASVYFDNFVIREVNNYVDLMNPYISGAEEVVTINKNEFFDVREGISAYDNYDGNISNLIQIEIKNPQNEPIDVIDTSITGVYKIKYFVYDSNENYKEKITYLVILEESNQEFTGYVNTNEILDGSFSLSPSVLPTEVQNAAYQDITDPGFWYMYNGSWSGAAATYGVTDGKFEIDVTNLAGEVWHFMLKQKGISLEKDTMYLLTFNGYSSLERPISVRFFPGLTEVDVNLTTVVKTFEIPFFYTGEDLETRIEFLFGGATGKVTLDNINLYKINSSQTLKTQDVFISEYIEGSSNNKALELYNPTNEDIVLNGYFLNIYSNGSTTATKSLDLSGLTIESENVIVICTDSFSYKDHCDIFQAFGDSDAVVFFNGDDAISLTKDGVLIDVFGVIGEDPGSGWVIGDSITANTTIIRKSWIFNGSAIWKSDEWLIKEQDNFQYLGIHSTQFDLMTHTDLETISEIKDSEEEKFVRFVGVVTAFLDEYTFVLEDYTDAIRVYTGLNSDETRDMLTSSLNNQIEVVGKVLTYNNEKVIIGIEEINSVVGNRLTF